MSRVAKMPIAVPQAPKCRSPQKDHGQGPAGHADQPLNGLVKVENNDGTLTFDAADESANRTRCRGTLRALVNNMVTGVTKGFEKKLTLVGVGYRPGARQQAEPVAGLFAPGRARRCPQGVNAKPRPRPKS